MLSFQVVASGAPLRRTEQDIPAPQGTQVLLQVLATGVCHSDLHIWDGYYEIGGGKQLRLADRGIKLPLTMGHETVGKVVAVGPDATGDMVGAVSPISRQMERPSLSTKTQWTSPSTAMTMVVVTCPKDEPCTV